MAKNVNSFGYETDMSSYQSNYNSSQANNRTLMNNFGDKNTTITNIFRNTKDFKDVTKYRLMRGVPDFGSLVQFNPYVTGYAAFIICQMPKFMELLAKQNPYYRKLMLNWMHIVEYEFKSFEGLEPMSAEVIQLGDDLNNINVISKVNMQSASEFSLVYDEKSGSPLTKFHKLYLSGIRDPRTQVRSYHGLIHSDQMDPGFENECFTFLFITTDDTMREPESATLIVAAQLNSADTDMYNFTKGDIGKKDVTVKFNGYPIQGAYVDMVARDMMKFLLSKNAGARQIIINSNNYNYTGLNTAAKTLSKYGTGNDYAEYPSLTMANVTAEFKRSSFYTSTNDILTGTEANNNYNQ